MNPSVSGEERARQRRLLGALLASPFILTPATSQAALSTFGIAGALALICAVFAASWLVALLLVMHGSTRRTELAALAGGGVLIGVVVGLSGGIASPVAALAIALPVEACWVRGTRDRRTLAAGLAVAGGALVLAAGMALAFGETSNALASAWLWLSPALYAATLLARQYVNEGAARETSDAATAAFPEDCFDAAVARIGRTGEVETASARTNDLLGVDPDLVLGSGLFERIHVADRVAFRCAIADVHETGRPQRLTVRIRMPLTPNGHASGYRPFEIEFIRVHATDSAVTAIVRDGSEMAVLRDELRMAREQAEMTEVTKSRFLATVSHELRTPLNAIIGFSDMLLHPELSGELTKRQNEHVSLIHEAGGHLLSVVNAILDVSKIEAGTYHIAVEPFELKPAVELCRAMLAPQADAKNVSLVAKLPKIGLEVAGDQRAVQQILLNLLSNAIKFTPEGGSVCVSASRQANHVRIIVDDNGIGIGADDLSRLGRPFSQVRNDYTRQYQGTGLGLSLVKGLVELHEGTMSIESAPGLGTTVTVVLPCASKDLTPIMPEQTGGLEGPDARRVNHGYALHKIA